MSGTYDSPWRRPCQVQPCPDEAEKIVRWSVHDKKKKKLQRTGSRRRTISPSHGLIRPTYLYPPQACACSLSVCMNWRQYWFITRSKILTHFTSDYNINSPEISWVHGRKCTVRRIIFSRWYVTGRRFRPVRLVKRAERSFLVGDIDTSLQLENDIMQLYMTVIRTYLDIDNPATRWKKPVRRCIIVIGPRDSRRRTKAVVFLKTNI